jgi:hypothetical protein
LRYSRRDHWGNSLHRKGTEIAVTKADEHLFVFPALQQRRHQSHRKKSHAKEDPRPHARLQAGKCTVRADLQQSFGILEILLQARPSIRLVFVQKMRALLDAG